MPRRVGSARENNAVMRTAIQQQRMQLCCTWLPATARDMSGAAHAFRESVAFARRNGFIS